MNYEEFKEKEKELDIELMNLRSNYYRYCNELFSQYKGKRVKIDYDGEEIEAYWEGWTMPRNGHIEPLLYKVRKDGTKSSFREYLGSVNPGNIKIRFSEEE